MAVVLKKIVDSRGKVRFIQLSNICYIGEATGGNSKTYIIMNAGKEIYMSEEINVVASHLGATLC